MSGYKYCKRFDIANIEGYVFRHNGPAGNQVKYPKRGYYWHLLSKPGSAGTYSNKVSEGYSRWRFFATRSAKKSAQRLLDPLRPQ